MPTNGMMDQNEITPESIMDRLRRQLETDREIGLIAPCSEDVLTRVVTSSVQTLWTESRIKTYIPILALRQARDEIRTLITVHPSVA